MEPIQFAIDVEGDFCYDIHFEDEVYHFLLGTAICWDIWTANPCKDGIVYNCEVYFDDETAVIKCLQ